MQISSFLLILLLATTAISAEPQKGTHFIVNQTTTLYSMPGYDYQSYKSGSEAFAKFEELGLSDLIPTKVAWPQQGSAVEYLRSATVDGAIYYQVRFETPHGDRTGYAKSTFFRADSVYEKSKEIIPPEKPQVAAKKEQPVSVQRTSPQETRAPITVAQPTPNVDCQECSAYNLTMLCQSSLFRDITQDVKNYTSAFKSSKELEEYFFRSRKNCKDDHHENYLNEYQHYVRDAAKAFQIPEPMLSCLLFIESRWDADAKSGSGAVGIAQFMPNTADTVGAIISSLGQSEKQFENLEQLQDAFQEKVRSNLKKEKQNKPIDPITKQERANFVYANTVLKNRGLALDWKSYIDLLKVDPAFVKANPQQAKSQGYPTRFNVAKAKEPHLAIGASALYLKHIMLTFQNQLDADIIEGKDQMLHFMVAVTGAYNMGPGNGLKLLGRPPSKKTRDWVTKLGKYSETKQHMEYIKRCMEKGNTIPPVVMKKEEKAEDKVCK